MKKKNLLENDEIIKKLEKMYQNYWIDTSNMDEEEWERLRKQYLKKDLDSDLKKSEKYKDQFSEDIV